jgi:hypothetical protein
MFDKDLTIEPFTDKVVFSMDRDLLDWDLVEEMSDADPSSTEYRKMMKDLRIGGRNYSNNNRRWRDYDDD